MIVAHLKLALKNGTQKDTLVIALEEKEIEHIKEGGHSYLNLERLLADRPDFAARMSRGGWGHITMMSEETLRAFQTEALLHEKE